MDEARRVIQPPLPHITTFAEEQSAEMRDLIFDNFNTLAVLFRAPPSSFLQGSSLDEEHHNEGLVPLSAAGQLLSRTAPYSSLDLTASLATLPLHAHAMAEPLSLVARSSHMYVYVYIHILAFVPMRSSDSELAGAAI